MTWVYDIDSGVETDHMVNVLGHSRYESEWCTGNLSHHFKGDSTIIPGNKWIFYRGLARAYDDLDPLSHGTAITSTVCGVVSSVRRRLQPTR